MTRKRSNYRNVYAVCIGIIFFILLQPLTTWAYEKEIRELSGTVAETITKAGKTRIAVVDFTDLQGNVTELGRFIAEEFALALLGKGQGFEMVDRTHLHALIKENKLSAIGLIDPATAQKLGQIAGVDGLITGTITSFGDTVRLAVKILDAKSAKLIGGVSADIPKIKAIEELLERGIGNGSMDTASVSSTGSFSSGKAVEVEGFVFKPGTWTRKGNETICTFSMMNNGDEDREVRIHSSSYTSSLVDNLGNKYSIKLIIGDRTPSLMDYLTEMFPPKIPVNVTFVAKDVNQDASNFTALIYINGFKSLVTVRNITMAKRNTAGIK